MEHPKTTPRKRGSQDGWTTPLPGYAFESPVKRRKGSTQRLPFSPTSPNAGRKPPGARVQHIFKKSTRRLQLEGNDEDVSVWSLPGEDSEDEKPPASKGRKRKRLNSSSGKTVKKLSRSRHYYKSVDPRHADMTTERLFDEGHIASGCFSYDHPGFAKDAAEFNDLKIDGKQVWQQQPFGPSTLHNNITITDHFRSLAPFLTPLEDLCTPRTSTERLFLKQQVQQYTTSGRRHRDGKNGRWRMCLTVHDPDAPANFKQLEVGVADAGKAKGGQAVNPWCLLARTATVRGKKVTVSEAAWEGRTAPTPLEKEATDQADYTAEQRGSEKSTRERKAEGANSCLVQGCFCTEAGAGCVCVGHTHVKNSSVGLVDGGVFPSYYAHRVDPETAF
eukprot:g16866.t1